MGIRWQELIILKASTTISKQFPNVSILEPCEKEWDKLLRTSGVEQKYTDLLIRRLALLSTLGAEMACSARSDWFELIEPTVYSMRFDRIKPINLRILFTEEDGQILLCAFNEQNSSDYKRAARLARNRMESARNDNE